MSCPPDAPAWKATGYADVLAHVDGRITRRRDGEQVVVATRQYAKRQRTWFRHQLTRAAVTRISPLAGDAVRACGSGGMTCRRTTTRRRVKIGITCYPTYGGSGAVATELGIALAARGHEVHFITYQQPFRLPNFLPGVYFHEVDVGNYPLFEYPPYDLALAVRMHEVVRDHGLDLLHVPLRHPARHQRLDRTEMLRETGHDVRVVTTLHGTDITIVGQERSFFTITKFSIEKSDAVTAVSRLPARRDLSGLRMHGLHGGGDPQLHRSGGVRPGALPDAVPRGAARRPQGPDAHLELPRGQARA